MNKKLENACFTIGGLSLGALTFAYFKKPENREKAVDFLGDFCMSLIKNIRINVNLGGRRSHSNTQMMWKDICFTYPYYNHTRINKIPQLKPWAFSLECVGIETLGELRDYICYNGYSGLLDIYGIGETGKRRIYNFIKSHSYTY